MIAFDVEKVQNTELFPQHMIADLNSGTILILFSQEKPLRGKGIHTHKNIFKLVNVIKNKFLYPVISWRW